MSTDLSPVAPLVCAHRKAYPVQVFARRCTYFCPDCETTYHGDLPAGYRAPRPRDRKRGLKHYQARKERGA